MCRRFSRKKNVSRNSGSRLLTTRSHERSEPPADLEECPPMSTSAPTPPRSEMRDLPAIQKLVADGLQRGYLTPEEMARALPSDLGADRLAEVRAFIGESGIRVVAGRRPAPRRSAPSKAIDDAPTNDPVRVYLREMGQVSLLTREGEVE